MMRRKKIGYGALYVAIGFALALAFICPARYLVVLLSLALICSGFALCKNC